MKPVIKYVGGKSQLLETIKDKLPPRYNKYFEPFVGGAAVLLGLNPATAFANDVNPELINMYLQIREQVEDVIKFLTALDVGHEAAADAKGYYYIVREVFNENLGANTPEQAARLIYLNKHCFNGLYRVNSQGYFNVPFNGRLKGDSFDAEHLRAVSRQIHDVEFSLGDFEDALVDADVGDFIFIDSPYAPISPTSFTDYTKEGFSYEDHLRLADMFNKLTAKGCYCMLTNHDTPLIRELYKDYKIETVDVRRSINRNGNGRTGKEVIITNY
jgi:DNA adenine methylase